MTTGEPVVFVVDDDLSVRQALSSLIRSVGLSVDTFASAGDFLRHVRPDVPSCLVLDVHLPDSSGLELPAELGSADVRLPIIYITGHGTIPMSVRAMKAGAVEFLTKPFREEELLAAVQQALVRDETARRERAERAALRQRFDRLTARERDVLALVTTGRLNKQIAAELGIAEQTVKVHRGRIMEKLGVESVAELVRFVERAAGRTRADPPAPPGVETRSDPGSDAGSPIVPK